MPRVAASPYVIRRPEQVACLVSPVRQEIADVLSRMGVASAAEIADALHRPPDALYYHLSALRRVGLVLGAGSRHRKGRREALFRTVAPALSLRYDSPGRGYSRNLVALVGSMMRLATRDYRRALLGRKAVLHGPGRELWAARTTGWLTRGLVAATNRRIRELTRAVEKPRGAGRLFAVTILLTPLGERHRPRRRQSGKEPRRA
jgi:predicted ArsR family transcriptional regulator